MKGLRGAVRDSLRNALVALEKSGCDAAGYRLTGPTVDRLCVVHLYATWRLLLAFPEPTRAVVIDVGQHLAEDVNRDIYTRLYEVLGMTPLDEPRTKPGCCDEGNPPVTPEIVNEMADAYSELTRQRRIRRSK